MLAGGAVMINWSDVAPEHRAAYYEWHSREHMPGRLAIPGFRRGRRYLAARAQRDFLVMYEVRDLAVLTGADYLAKANRPSPLTQRTTPHVKNSIRGMAKVAATFGRGTGGCALTLRFDALAGRDEALRTWLAAEALPQVAAVPEIAGAHLLIADPEASGIVPVERQGRPTVIPKWIVLIEAVTPEALEAAADGLVSAGALQAHGGGAAERDTYSLQVVVPAAEGAA